MEISSLKVILSDLLKSPPILICIKHIPICRSTYDRYGSTQSPNSAIQFSQDPVPNNQPHKIHARQETARAATHLHLLNATST